MIVKIDAYRNKNLEKGFNNTKRYGFYKLIKIAFDIRNKIKEQAYIDSLGCIA